jgi:hypothetical protein
MGSLRVTLATEDDGPTEAVEESMLDLVHCIADQSAIGFDKDGTM